jgi:hypothetical protein
MVSFRLIVVVMAVNIGIKDIGSIATIALRRFWKKTSCIKNI